MRYVDWRGIPRRVLGVWRTSLSVRVVALTLVLSTIAVVGIGAYISTTVRQNLFTARVNQAIALSERANLSTQSRFATTEGADPNQVETTLEAAYRAVTLSSVTPSGTYVAILRTPGQSGTNTPSLVTPGFDVNVISASMRSQVGTFSEEARAYWQSVSLDLDSGRHPGLVVGSPVDVPNSGQYELYLVFDLTDTQQTVDLVLQTIIIGGIALVVLIGAVAFTVTRLVVGPVRMAAETSERLAAGELDIRIPERGQDVIATLARSFNGMAESLQRQITQLAALSQVQQRFVSDVSHELRTPLTTIRLASGVLHDQRESFEPTTARTVELLHTQVQRFELLLGDLLEMSRYDAGAVEMYTEPTNLVRLVDDVVDSVMSLASSKGSEIRIIAPGGYFEADVDARRIRRIVQNLLGNAIDHGEGRPISVYVDSDARAVALAVRDWGVGMTPASVERVFDRFWRADPSRQRTTGGSGLGLAISLEDAALHGGWLEVWSAPGQGSCFRLTLPRVRGAALVDSPLPLPPDFPTASIPIVGGVS